MRWKTTTAVLCGLALALAGCRMMGIGPVFGGKSPPDPSAMNYLHLPDANAGLLVKSDHYLRNWLLLGPYRYETGRHGGDEDQGAARVKFVANEADLLPQTGAQVGDRQWRPYEDADAGAQPERIDLNQFYAGIEYAAAYLGCYVHSPKDVDDLILYIGSDDYVTVWINGREVHHYDEGRRSAFPDDDVVKGISLKKGWNRVVVKCVDVVLAWELYFRFADSSGRPMRVTDGP
jgi:hypothetical protein